MLKFLVTFISLLISITNFAHAGLVDPSSAKTKSISASQYNSMIAEARKQMAQKKALPVSSIVSAVSNRKFIGRTRDGLNFSLAFSASKSYRIAVNGLVKSRAWTVSNGNYCAGDNVKLAKKNCTDRVFKVRGGYVFWQNNKVANVIVAIN